MVYDIKATQCIFNCIYKIYAHETDNSRSFSDKNINKKVNYSTCDTASYYTIGGEF